MLFLKLFQMFSRCYSWYYFHYNSHQIFCRIMFLIIWSTYFICFTLFWSKDYLKIYVSLSCLFLWYIWTTIKL